MQDDLLANKDTTDSIPCESSIDGKFGDHQSGGEYHLDLTGENAAKEIFFKEINFSPDLTIRIDYQVWFGTS